MTIARACVGFCLCLMLSISLFGQERQKQGEGKSCREFVTTFYKWYVEISSRRDSISHSDRALKDQPYLFSSELLRRLKEESEVQDRAGSDLVNLDIDPFAGPDGVGESFVVKKVTVKDKRCWVGIVWNEPERTTPDVTPELTDKNGRWIFVNFYYPNPSNSNAKVDLLSELKAARESWKADGLLNDKKP